MSLLKKISLFNKLGLFNKVGLLKSVLPPNLSDALVWLDGKRSGENMLDVISGKLFPITNRDWDDDFVGFPLKSAATISAPVGDLDLIAADVNNFLYDSGGTPNENPVVSFFQDIDYEHKLFCRNAEQKTTTVAVETQVSGIYEDIDIETYEPRVLDIVLYNTVKTGDSLTSCQNYYNVPTEDLTAKWVDPVAGDDTTGDGSKLLPWKSVIKANATVTTGIDQVVYFKTGLSVEAGIVQVTKNVIFSAISKFVIQNLATSYNIMVNTTAVAEFNRLIIDGTNTVSRPVYAYAAAENKTFNNCLFTGGSIYTMNILGTEPMVFNNCVINVSTGTAWLLSDRQLEFNGCYISSTINSNPLQGSGDFIVKYCKVKSVNAVNTFWFHGVSTFSVSIISNYFEVVDASYLFRMQNSTAVDCTYNRYNITAATITGGMSADSTGDVLIRNNVVENIGNNDVFIVAIDGDSFLSSNIYTSESGDGNFCSVSRSDTVLIEKNSISKKGAAGYGIAVGAEAATINENTINSIIIRKNSLLLAFHYNQGASATVHGIFVGFQKNAIIELNNVKGAGLGIIQKGSTGTDYTGGRTSDNVLENCSSGLYSKGVSGIFYEGNTVVNDIATKSVQCVLLGINTGGDEPANITLKNNIFHLKSGLTGSYIYNFGLNADVGHVIDYNVIKSDVDSTIGKVSPTTYILSAWQALGYDINSQNSDPLLIDGIPQTGSPALSNGENLGSPYNIGLDASTDWGDTDTVPAVVTKQQVAPWDVGAYVS